MSTSPADNWVAVFAIPSNPYYIALPVWQQVLVKRDGHEYRDALVPLFNNPQPQLVSVLAEDPYNTGIFITYVNVPLQSHPELKDTISYQNVVGVAITRGQEWEIALHQQRMSSEQE